MGLVATGKDKMQIYEYMLILDPRLNDEEVSGVVDEIDGIVNAHSGNVLTRVLLGKKALAYPIKKLSEGVFVLIYFEVANGREILDAIFAKIRYNDKIIRRNTFKVKREEVPSSAEISFKEFAKVSS